MPITVITLKNAPISLRGDLTRWMQEISTGVYIGNFNSRIREYLWGRVTDTIGAGEATMCFAARNELGYDFQTENTNREVVNYDGLPLVMIPKIKNEEAISHGYSNASKIHMARRVAAAKNVAKPKEYVVIDIETTGFDEKNDRILEIGAVKCNGKEKTYFCKLIKAIDLVPLAITQLTGITDELLMTEGEPERAVLQAFRMFVENIDLVGYNIGFDMKFLNFAMHRVGLSRINNRTHDLMKIVKKEQMFQSDYKLETSLRSYGIKETVQHRALEDAKVTCRLADKVNKF